MVNLKTILLSVIFLMAGLVAKAEIVISADTDTSIQIAEITNITFDGDFSTGNLVVNFKDGTSKSTPIASIKKLTVSADEESNAIEQVNTQAMISVKGNMLFVTADGGKMSICDLNGRQQMVARLSGGMSTFSLDSLANGAYVLNVNGKVVKFLKK